MGIEPTSKAWEAFILPMNYACKAHLLYHVALYFARKMIKISPPDFSDGENSKSNYPTNFIPVPCVAVYCSVSSSIQSLYFSERRLSAEVTRQ